MRAPEPLHRIWRFHRLFATQRRPISVLRIVFRRPGGGRRSFRLPEVRIVSNHSARPVVLRQPAAVPDGFVRLYHRSADFQNRFAVPETDSPAAVASAPAADRLPHRLAAGFAVGSAAPAYPDFAAVDFAVPAVVSAIQD